VILILVVSRCGVCGIAVIFSFSTVFFFCVFLFLVGGFSSGFLNRYFVAEVMSGFFTVMGFDILGFVSSLAKPAAVLLIVGLVLWNTYGLDDERGGGW